MHRRLWLAGLALALAAGMAGATMAQTAPGGGAAPPAATVQTAADSRPALPPAVTEKLQPFLTALWADAAAAKISRQTFEQAFNGIELDGDILDRLTNQPELVSATWDYIGLRVSETRIANGRARLAELGPLLTTLETRFGVDRHIILAIWGMESSYGAMQGNNGIVRSLATLAIIDERRPAFWRSELLKALTILERGDVAAARMTGSWAGAMGHMQFMPSSFLAHAVDQDGDGRRDIWDSVPDALASAANYLKNAKWRAGEPWGFEVSLPDGFDFAQSPPTQARTVAEWQTLGLSRPGGLAMPSLGQPVTLLLPAGARGPAFLVTSNFRALLSYNNAVPYALAVGHLADRIAGGPPIQGFWPTDDAPLDKAGREELQRLLTDMGFDVGAIDGIIGSQTRVAVRAFQRRAGLAEDGHAGSILLKRLKEATQR